MKAFLRGENGVTAKVTYGNARALNFYVKHGFFIAVGDAPSDSADVVLVKQVE
jgi:hypothetical protein